MSEINATEMAAVGLQPVRGASAELKSEMAFARWLLASRGRVGEPSAEERLGDALIEAARGADAPSPPDELQALGDAPKPKLEGIGSPDAYDAAIRRAPQRASAPPTAAGRAVARTLGPFLDAAGRHVWVDLFSRGRMAPIVRAPQSEADLLVPLGGRITGAAHYELPASSVWIRARLLAATAPANAYCGIAIKGGELTLSAPATVAGGTLQIGAGVTATLEIETDPAPAPGETVGADGAEALCEPPAKARFVFTAAGGALEQAGDAVLTAYGTKATLRHEAGSAGTVEPLLNRVWLPLQATDADAFAIRRVRSKLFRPAGEATKLEGAWALAMTLAPSPDSLGNAEGAGGVGVRLGAGLRADWRGLSAGPVALGEAIAMTESGRLTLAAARAADAVARQTLELWSGEDGPKSQLALGFATERPLRAVSEADAGDMLEAEASLEAALDRPVGADGARFPLRADGARLHLSHDGSGFRAQVSAEPAGGEGPRSLALSNALICLRPASALLASGAWETPDRIVSGLTAVLFGVATVIPTLRDPYVTNLAPPACGKSRSEAEVVSVVAWADPKSPKLALNLLRSGSLAEGLDVLSRPDPAPRDRLVAERTTVERRKRRSFDDTGAEDAAAELGLRRLFERTAGPARERVLLLDVSTSIDLFGVGLGGSKHDVAGGGLRIEGLDLSAPGRNQRVVLLPQFQWEPVTNEPNPLVGPFPDRLASARDGGATALGTRSVTLVPIAPERLTKTMLEEFNATEDPTPLATKLTLPFGIKAAARLQPRRGATWASVDLHRPATADGRLTGGLQIRARAHPDGGPTQESPSFPGAAWQTRNGIDPESGAQLGLSVLSASIGNPGVEAFFNHEMGPGGSRPRVPVTRVELSGYGASGFSAWANPNAVAATSQVRFDVFVGRTAYEVVQAASILLPWAVPVVRTITLERRKEGAVVRFDSGWVATGPGLYAYPPPDPEVATPPGWTAIETHPGVVRGAWNVRRIRETDRVVAHDFPPEGARPATTVELLEVRFDADFELEGVIQGAGSDGRVPCRNHVGYVQRLPQGYPLLPEHFAAILESEGPVGGSVDCVLDIAASGQRMQIARIDVAPAPEPLGGPPHFAASARGALALPADGEWATMRKPAAASDPQPVDTHAGVPLIRAGTASGSIAPTPAYRIGEPRDLLHPSTPDVEYGLVQSSTGHRVLFPRPQILAGTTEWSSTERPALADTYTLSLGTGLLPAPAACLVGEAPWGLAVDAASGRFTLLPAPTMRFTAPPGVADRRLVDTGPFKIRTRYETDMRFTLDPTQAQPWRVEGDSVLTTMDLGPFEELLGLRHGFRVGARESPAFVNAATIYPPALQPVLEILEFLADLLGVDEALGVDAHQGSFNFRASLALNMVNPHPASGGYIDFDGLKIKGKLAAALASSPHWKGSLKFTAGTLVPAVKPILAGGEIDFGLEGTAHAEQKVTIEARWSFASFEELGPLDFKGHLYFGIQVIVSNSGSWQIGLLLGVVGSTDISIAKVTLRIELLAAFKVLSPAESPPSGSKHAIGQAKVALDVTIATFVTISVEVSVQYEGTIHI